MEREVLLLLRRLHAEEGSVTRERLTVIGRGRGLEIARSLLLLKSQGLVDVVEKRPSFWRRLFGAKPQELLIPTPAQADEVFSAPAADLIEAQEAPFAEALSEPGYETEAALAQDQSQGEAAVAPLPTAADTAPVEAEAILAPAPEPLPPVAEPAPVPAYIPEPVPEPVVAPQAPLAPVQASPAPRPPRPAPVPQGYTDELGGAPADFNLTPALDPALVEGMRDFLAGMGLELTFAGEALAAQRLQAGAAIGDVVGELVVFALAHAAHHESLSGYAGTAEDLRDYAQAILEELERLVEAGEISRESFEAQRGVILQLSDRNADRSALVAALLADPIGGAAPPAILPEELRGIEDGGDGFLQDL